MEVMKKILISIICLSGLTSCAGEDGLNKYRRNGQLVDLEYKIFDDKMINDDSFIFFLKREGCPGCEEFYPSVDEFLKENEEAKIYTLQFDDLEGTEALTIASYYVEALGNAYFTKKGYSTTTLYTPSICKVVNGEVVDAYIGILDKEGISNFYQGNYASLDSYYKYNHKVQKGESFNVFVSINKDQTYDATLRTYFSTNKDVNGYYLDISSFDESESERILNRVNYYLGEENEIQEMPEYCLLQYKDGKLVNYISAKYDETMLNALYNK